MLWIQKGEVSLDHHRKKIVLERFSFWGHRRRLKFIEMSQPFVDPSIEDDIISVTQRRVGWRFRYKHPLKKTFYRKNAGGDWIPIGSVFL